MKNFLVADGRAMSGRPLPRSVHMHFFIAARLSYPEIVAGVYPQEMSKKFNLSEVEGHSFTGYRYESTVVNLLNS